MAGLVAWNPWRYVSPLLVAIVILVVTIALGAGLRMGGTAILGVVLGLLLLGSLAVGVYLWVRCRRPVAAVGTIVTGLSVAVAFYVSPQAWLLWTVLFFVGVILIAWDTRQDTAVQGTWPLLLLRVGMGWAWVDNAQDHFWNGQWFAGNGGGFAQAAGGAASRPPGYFLDPLYQGFLKGAVVTNPDAWAALTASAELAIGLLLAVGFATPVAAFLSLWQSTHYILMKSFISHGAYTDKVFFAADLVLLITMAGLAYGVDAALQRHVPAWFGRLFLGLTRSEAAQPQPAPVGRPEPAPG